ncbi:MAG: hypothetical protein PHU23_03235 [Dehalococcoidales bacterium]|nr:hypothetical protein [Dehalococcoidales bacterium]
MKKEPINEHKLSKNARRKSLRYGKRPVAIQPYIISDNHQKPNANGSQLLNFILSTLKPNNPKIEEDHSLDELEYEKRQYPLYPGGFESGKHR